ncbi:MAG: hypothetical protein AB7L90_13560 [Hyphomicrobiaceae bacterium]
MQLKLEAQVIEEWKTAAEETTVEPGSDRNDGLLDTAMPIMIAAYGVAIAIVTFTFWQSGDTLLSIAICAVYMVMFFGVPIMMARVRNRHDERWCGESPDAVVDRVAIFGGSIGRKEAVLQMVIVPLAVVVAFAAFAVIWLSVKP